MSNEIFDKDKENELIGKQKKHLNKKISILSGIIVLAVVICFFGTYFFTGKLLNKDNLNNILINLNYKILTQINKERIIYIYKDKYEIVFDNVENLGLFIELKIHNHNTLELNEYDNLLKIATHFNINLNNLVTKRYPELSIN